MPTKTVHKIPDKDKSRASDKWSKIREIKIREIIPMKLIWECPYCNYINSESRTGGLPGKIRAQCGHCGKPVILTH